MIGPNYKPTRAALVAMAQKITPQSDYITIDCKPLIDKVINHLDVTDAARRARVAFPTREDVARHAILLAKETNS